MLTMHGRSVELDAPWQELSELNEYTSWCCGPRMIQKLYDASLQHESVRTIMKLSALSAASVLLATICVATNPLTPDKVEADLKTDELRRVLRALDKIGRDNGGTRAFGTPGYKASVDYVLERAQTRFGKEMDTYVQPFNFTYDETLEIYVHGPEGEDVFVISPQYNPPTPLPDGIEAPLINTPVNDETGSMCLPEQWEGIDATGKLALVKRGICDVSTKLKLAKAHGALGVILYNQNPGTDYATPTLGAENIGLLIPVGIIPLDVATGWIARLEAGETLVVTLLVDSISEDRETWNIISETKEGNPDSVVMLGAHLDSVQEGPGINDDGSGTAALLEIMGSVKKYKGFPNKIRFAWWAAEESGLVGSYYYTEHLTEDEADKIKYYYNFDMIASPYPKYEISSYEYSGIGPQLLEDYIVAQGKTVDYAEFDGRSDYAGFTDLGIPTAGLFTGDGAPW
ncbi:putative aminopeptidase y protein [Phaeoacremonium minimum UCRPA7]|uniref:Peptide hydrolase n=1 Tax=Phaeoacremonium minimum (strain UCR-PA7) TaxID=1286976 RepID=R8BSH4_PHAM7|nr:putative aminopeptidase y protein [Phaeoacremonium minimum UCRPA7]EOO02312.1 putative aminopeptidase y protein [Phaeoacremonium minimum UCRPA7]